MWLLPAFPVPRACTPFYGRADKIFTVPLDFSVPLMCATTKGPLMYAILIDASSGDVRDWKFYIPRDQMHPCRGKVLSVTQLDKQWCYPHNMHFLANLLVASAQEDNMWLQWKACNPLNPLGCTQLLHAKCNDDDLLALEAAFVGHKARYSSPVTSLLRPSYVSYISRLELMQVKQFRILSPMVEPRAPVAKSLPLDALGFPADIDDVVGSPSDADAQLQDIALTNLSATPTTANARLFFGNIGRLFKANEFSLPTLLRIYSCYHPREGVDAVCCEFNGFGRSVWVLRLTLLCIKGQIPSRAPEFVKDIAATYISKYWDFVQGQGRPPSPVHWTEAEEAAAEAKLKRPLDTDALKRQLREEAERQVMREAKNEPLLSVDTLESRTQNVFDQLMAENLAEGKKYGKKQQ
jgi:hypothetical protein